MTPIHIPTEDPSLRALDLPATDQALREDVRELGALVGDILAEQEGDDFLDKVESVRVAAIARREAGQPAAELAQTLQGLDLEAAEQLLRAFAL